MSNHLGLLTDTQLTHALARLSGVAVVLGTRLLRTPGTLAFARVHEPRVVRSGGERDARAPGDPVLSHANTVQLHCTTCTEAGRTQVEPGLDTRL